MAAIYLAGFVQGLVSAYELIFSYIYKDSFSFSPAKANFIAALYNVGCAIKPAWSALSDNVCFFGYKRKTYITASGLIGGTALLLLSMWNNHEIIGVSSIIALGCATTCSYCVAEALIIRTAFKSTPSTEYETQQIISHNTSRFFALNYIGKLLIAICISIFLVGYGANVFLVFGSVLFFCMAFVGKTMSDIKVRKRNIGGTFNNLQNSDLDLTLEGESEMIQKEEENQKFSKQNIKKAMKYIRSPLMYKSSLLLFLRALTPNFRQVRFFYFTNWLGFDPSFIAFLRLISYVGMVLGLIAYNKGFKNMSFKRFYTFMSLVCAALTLIQLVLVFRANQSIGISDGFFAIIDTLIVEISFELSAFTPFLIASKIAPKEVEGTIFAIVISVANITQSLSMIVGSLLAEVLQIDSYAFDNYWILIVFTSASFLLTIPLARNINFDDIVERIATKDKKETEISTAPPSYEERLDDADEKPTVKFTNPQTVYGELYKQDHFNTFS